MEDTKDRRKKKKLFPFGDYDKDGVPNFKDCEPFDPTKHVRGGSYSPSGGGHSYSPPSSRGGRGGYTPSGRGIGEPTGKSELDQILEFLKQNGLR